MLRRTIGLLALAFIVVPRSAPAQRGDADASGFFREGATAYARGDFRAAALAFEEAYARAPRGATKYDAAIAWEQARSWERAADDFDVAIADPTLDPKHAAEARRRLDALAKKTGLVLVQAHPSASISVAHVQRAHPPLRLHLLPGAQELRAEYPSGRAVVRSFTVDANATVSLDLPLEDEVTTAPRPQTPLPMPPPVEPVPPRDATSPFVPGGWLTAAAGVVATGLGLGFGVVALDAKHDFDRSRQTSADDHDRAATFRAAANVALIGGITLVVGGIAMVLYGRTRHP